MSVNKHKFSKMSSSSDEAVVIAACLLAYRKLKRKRKRPWTRPWLSRRQERSVYHTLLPELSVEDPDTMRQWIRLNREQYHSLLQLVIPLIKKEDTHMRDAVTPGERLTLTLRYLATGETHSSLACQFRISRSLISTIIPEVCRTIYQVLGPKYVKLPCTVDEWRQVASDFFTEWNYPMCLGALDGKRVLIAKPHNSGSDYYDYKGHFSTIMMALVDANYNFLYVDVGACGRASDGGVWDHCSLKNGLENHTIRIPEPDNIPFTNRKSPYVILGDDAFPLKSYLMKPYAGRGLTEEQIIFNYRLSRARRMSENAFGILAAKFQIYKKPINTSPQNVKDIVLATVALHNFLRQDSQHTYFPNELLDREDVNKYRLERGQWRDYPHDALEGLQAVPRGQTVAAKNIRDTFKDYFNLEGKVSWQDHMALLH